MRFAKLALSSLAVIAVAAFGVTAIAQQPTTPTPPPQTTPEAPAPATTQAAEPAVTVEPTPVPVAAPAAMAAAPVEHAAAGEAHAGGEHHLMEPKGGWQHEELFGTFDQNALQRGYKVYSTVCSTCHGMKLLSFRNLGEQGGPFYDEKYPNPNDNPVVRQLASTFPNQTPSIDPDTGEAIMVASKTSDRIHGPYGNDTAARASNGGALPPDLSVITKARHGGAGYIYSLLNGFVAPPVGLQVNQGQHYNTYFPGDTGSQWSGDPRHKPPGGFLAMASPLEFADVAFDDGTPSNVEQMAHDVAVYLAWAGDPKAVARKQMGTAVIPYLLIFALLAFLSYRRLWRNVEH